MSFLSQPITLQSLFGPKRTIGPFTVQVVINENTSDVLTITKQPVQQGAPITDHAYKEPTVFSHSILLKDQSFPDTSSLSAFGSSLISPAGGLSKLYQDLLDLQNSRQPFSIITPKRIYQNMLFATLSQTTDKTTENCLAIHATYQQVIIVNVTAVQVNRSLLKNPGSNGATQNAGRKQSALFTLFGVGG